MSGSRDPVEELLNSISEGSPVDWESAARDAGAADHDRIEALRDLSRIADFHRRLQQGSDGSGAPASAASSHAERWGDLLLLEPLGSGANAEVFRAWDVRLQREVALKLHRVCAGTGARGAEEALLQEGRAAARIRHPNVVAVHGIGSHDGEVGLWMELVRGRPRPPRHQAREHCP